MKLVNTILNIVFPVYCLSCGKSGKDLCLECLSVQGEAEYQDKEWIFPLFDYRHPIIKKSIWLLKYSGKKRLAKIFAEVLYGKILEELSEITPFINFDKIILIPIPLSPKRKRERGFNQAELICKELIILDKINKKSNLHHGVDVNFTLETNVLIKIKDTIHQAKIEDRSKRLKNMIDSFTIKNEDIIKNRNIILIDDVLTTGATLSEAKKMLKNSGAKKVLAFTVAH